MKNRVERYGEVIPLETRKLISSRYHTVTKAINDVFWNSESINSHSFYVGSYGRNTAIKTSDIDILVELPDALLDHLNGYLNGNSQSRLLQTVRSSILNTYPRSDVRADGQVVKIDFSDGICFEILPAFKNWGEGYRHPDSNAGGRWLSTDPKAEQEAMEQKNIISNGLLYDTCRHIRYIHDKYYSSYHLSGIVIDSFVYRAIGSWRWLDSGEQQSESNVTYEQALLEYYIHQRIRLQLSIDAPGSNATISTSSSYECLRKVLEKMC